MDMNCKEAKRGNDITCIHQHCYDLVQVLPSTDRKVENGQKTRTGTFSLAIIQVSTWYTELTLHGVVFNEEAVALTEFITKYQKKFHSFYSGKFTNVTMHINTHNL